LGTQAKKIKKKNLEAKFFNFYFLELKMRKFGKNNSGWGLLVLIGGNTLKLSL